MESYKRFSDENYKNWLKTAESLYILRRHIRDFVENETETYHQSLRGRLKGVVCVKQCKSSAQGKKLDLCDKCQQWRDKIFENHLMKTGIHWENCRPYLWSTEKWEVAKAYMPRTQRDHQSYDQFDITAILNFMDHCRHFRTIKNKFFSQVIHVRNKVMHSPELRLTKEGMEDCIANVVQLAKTLEPHVPGLKTISEEIQQFKENLEKYCGQSSLHAEDSKEENMKLMNREHQSLKDKIEFLAQHYEEQQNADLKKELQGMKNFLEQNKDLLENLGPHVNKLDEIQEKVNRHDWQIDNLENRVDKLEKETPDAVFIGDAVKFKNHLLEEAKKRKWLDPIFTEVPEPTGYRGRVEVNGHTFTGSHVCNSKKSAHQEVAKKALEYFLFCCDRTEEPSPPGCRDQTSISSAIPSVTPATTSSNALFYATATVVLKNQEVVSDGCAQEEHAIDSAYKTLARLFGLNAPEQGNSFRSVVLAHFETCRYPQPSECLYQQGDKNFCKLLLCGPFTFRDKEGSVKKKQAEQQAAVVALQQLSGVLNCSSEAVDGGNYKGFLKERLEAHGLQQPEFSTERKEVVTSEVEGPSTSVDDSHPYSSSTLRVVGQNARPPAQGNGAVLQPPATAHPVHDDVHLAEPQGTQTPPVPNTVAKLQCADIYTLLALFNLKPPSVTIEFVTSENKFSTRLEVILDSLTFNCRDPCTSSKEAIRKAYYVLGCALGICQTSTDATMLVKQDFSQKSLPLPKKVIEASTKPFYCSLTDISYSVVYEGQGSTEADARADGLQKALRALPVLLGYDSLPSSCIAEEMEAQINTILRSKGQKHLTQSLQGHRHMSSARLLFKDYTMRSTSQANKKANRSHLSRRILGLLGEKTEPNCPPFRNALDEWFIKRGLHLPVFEDTEEAQGSMATFSVSLLCSHSDWEDSLEAANEKLIQELSQRFRYLTEQNEY